MKKILIAIITFLCLPMFCLAADYDIKHFYIDAILKENGDMEVAELIVLDGTFNGYEDKKIYRITAATSVIYKNFKHLLKRIISNFFLSLSPSLLQTSKSSNSFKP